MTTHIMQMGSTFRFMSAEDIKLHPALPARTYKVSFDKRTEEYFLEPVGDFKRPSKIYGDTEAKAARVLNTFAMRTQSTGVHLNGVKGSGKTLLTKLVSLLARERGWPTIIINQPFGGDGFNQFMQAIPGEAVVIFDEFEKVYNWQEQNKLLTLLDGVYPTKKLFMLTSNEASDVNKYLKNRPGRIYYSFEFDTLDPTFVQEYAEDNLVNQANVGSLVSFSKIFSFFNFDMLAAAIEEMNRYDETLDEVLKYMNIRPELRAKDEYTMSLVFGEQVVIVNEKFNNFSPMSFNEWVPVKDAIEGKLDEDDEDEAQALFDSSVSEGVSPSSAPPSQLDKSAPEVQAALRALGSDNYVQFTSTHIRHFDGVKGVYTYVAEKNGHEFVLTLRRNGAPLVLDMKTMLAAAW